LYSLNDKSTKILYQQRLSQKLGENAPESAETLYQHICDCIHSAAREALGEQGKGKKVVENIYGQKI
jgi:DNA-binding winged helix-turn-helix (wHTH) protein